MKKITSILIILAVCVCAFCGCNGKTNDNNKIKIVTTVFPLYDWVNQVLGDKKNNAEVTLLLSENTDFHSFQPTEEDKNKITGSDLFLYVGGESEAWAEDIIKEAPNTLAINLINELGELAQVEIANYNETEENAEATASEETEYETDEHIWLSLVNAKAIVCYVALALGKVDTQNAEYYKANANIYLSQLVTLDSKYSDTASNKTNDALVFCDRFPFRYIMDDYQIKYYSAYSACNKKAEISSHTITFLAEKTDELALDNVIVFENSDGKIAEEVIGCTKEKNQKILVLETMEATTFKDAQNGASYIKIMEQNLEVLKEALGA